MPDTPRTPLQSNVTVVQDTLGEFSEFSGFIGGAFAIYGKGFGEERQPVIVNETPLEVSSWRDHVIKGRIPKHLKPGSAVLKIGDKSQDITLTR